LGLKDRLKKLTRSGMQSFRLQDGSRFYYDPQSPERILHTFDCMRASYSGEPYPEPPATLLALCKARDRAAAFEQVAGGNFGLFPYEVEALIERGELVPREMVARAQEDFSE